MFRLFSDAHWSLLLAQAGSRLFLRNRFPAVHATVIAVAEQERRHLSRRVASRHRAGTEGSRPARTTAVKRAHVTPRSSSVSRAADHPFPSSFYDPSTAELCYDVSVSGFAADDVRLIALHRGDREKPGGVLVRLVEAGALAGRGSVALGYRARQDLRAGRMCVQVYSRQHPLGALRARVALPST